MTLESYPAELSPPLREGYGFEHVSTLSRTPLVCGRARQRRRSTTGPSMVPVSIFFKSPEEIQLFESWYRFVIADGGDWFNCRIKSPAGLKPYVCRFVKIYDGPFLLGANYWKITGQLELRERPLT